MTTNLEMALYRLSEVERELKHQAEEIIKIEQRNAARDRERAEAERKQLIAGIMALGAVIMALGGVIWSYRSVIFRGTP